MRAIRKITMKSKFRTHQRTWYGTSRALASLLFILALFAGGCSGGSAPSLDSSAQAWVEYPYEGSILPMEPVTLVVYAADSAGVSYIQIKVNGEFVPSITAFPMTTDGSSRLVRVDQSWIPSAQGEYFVEAVGVNLAGASGGSGSTRFCVVACEPAAASTSTPTPSAGKPPTSTPTPALPIITLPAVVTPTFTKAPAGVTPETSGDVTIEFFASPPYVNAGNCYTLHWDVTGSDQVYLNDSFVYFRGMEEYCPCETETHTLRVIKPDGASEERTARVDVYGSCSAPPPIEPPTEAPPSDTSGPSFNGVYAFWESCDVYGQADIYDPSGVSWAEFWYNKNNEGWNWIKMNESGGLWTSQVGISVNDGIGTPSGSIVYKVRALDSLNNESWSGETPLPYTGCGGTQ